MQARLATLLAGIGALTSLSAGQSPDVMVRLDVSICYRTESHGLPRLAAFDPLGRHSTVTLELTLEPGFDVVLSQRFQTIPHDPDNSSFDEYYIQDKGYWRLGKQYLPFGSGTVLREAVYAGVVHLTVGEQAFPAMLGYTDTGKQKQQGFFGRIGGKFGISAIFGRHIAIGGSSLTVIRKPEESPGLGHGYKRAIGVDAAVAVAPDWSFNLDHVSLRSGETASDKIVDITDLTLRWKPKYGGFVLFGLTHEWKSVATFLRAHGQFVLFDGVFLEPFVRLRNGKLMDASLTLRVKP